MKVEERQSRQSEENFLFRETPIEEHKSYTYLGTVVISSNGKFKANMQKLCKTATRAMYTLLTHTNKYSGGNIKLLMDLFDKIIVPYMYIQTVRWGLPSLQNNLLAIVLSENQQKNLVEKIQISFLKHLLGINSHSNNWAVLSETTSSKPILLSFAKLS